MQDLRSPPLRNLRLCPPSCIALWKENWYWMAWRVLSYLIDCQYIVKHWKAPTLQLFLSQRPCPPARCHLSQKLNSHKTSTESCFPGQKKFSSFCHLVLPGFLTLVFAKSPQDGPDCCVRPCRDANAKKSRTQNRKRVGRKNYQEETSAQ